MADPVTAIAVVAATAQAGKAYFQSREAESKMEAINLERAERTLQHQQKTMANFELTSRLLDEQTAKETTRGVSLGSPSFEAIQRNTANIGAKRQRNIDIEADIAEFNSQIEEKNVQDTLWSQLFGDVAQGAQAFAGIKSKMGTKGE